MSDDASTPPTPDSPPSFHRETVAEALTRLAEANLYVGTSSWKYPGWIGQLYSEDRYLWRGKLSETRFNRDCLEEYASVFKTVCVDAGYYRFPSARYLEGLAAQVPDDFRFAFKVTDEITIRKFTRLPRFGDRAGKPNDHYLDANLFRSAFLRPCEAIREKVGLLIFEFSHFWPSDYERGRDFAADLDAFLGELPPGWQYGVEIRNAGFLKAPYFEMLARHEVAHVYNSWQRMPPLGEQMALPGSRTNPDFTGARLLLRPGRAYQEAVDRFSPYDRVRDEQPEVREAAADLIRNLLKQRRRRGSFLFVNNRLEGNALATIEGILRLAGTLADEATDPGSEGGPSGDRLL